MLLQITLTQPPATDLGYLLHKHPDRCQRFELSFGAAHVLYPEASDARCTAALIVEVDAVSLSRGHQGEALEPYVNDRPYLASSYLSVAIASVYASALSGTSRDRPQLVDVPLPLEARIAAVPRRGDWGEGVLRRMFEPLGYTVSVTTQPIDERFPEWGSAACVLDLQGRVPLRDLLSHLYVLLPALDGAKHYKRASPESSSATQSTRRRRTDRT